MTEVKDKTKAAEAAQLDSVTDYHEDREIDSSKALQVLIQNPTLRCVAPTQRWFFNYETVYTVVDVCIYVLHYFL